MKRLIVFTGAGVSAESGLKTFRDEDGLWEGHKVEEVASPIGFKRHKEKVLRFYNQRHKQLAEVQPNEAHQLLKDLEEFFEVIVITQNVDDLHERAGSSHVLHLHGSLVSLKSIHHCCQRPWPLGAAELKMDDCCEHRHAMRPDVVWFGESVPNYPIALDWVKTADYFLLIGSSLQVYPAAGLVEELPAQIPGVCIDPQALVLPKNFTQICHGAVEGMKTFMQEVLPQWKNE